MKKKILLTSISILILLIFSITNDKNIEALSNEEPASDKKIPITVVINQIKRPLIEEIINDISESLFTYSYADIAVGVIDLGDLQAKRGENIRDYFVENFHENIKFILINHETIFNMKSLECDTSINDIKVSIRETDDINLISCSFTVYLNLIPNDDKMNENIGIIECDATMIRKSSKWKIKYMKISGTNLKTLLPVKNSTDETKFINGVFYFI